MSEVTLQLLFARHAESLGNVETTQEYDRADPALTAHGVLQAQLLGERLAAGRLDAVFASPLTRAVHTACEVAQRQSPVLRVELLPELMEVDTPPDCTGCPREILSSRFPLALPCTEKSPAGGELCLGEENYEIRTLRAERCVDYLCSRFNSGERILVVSHGGFTGFFLRTALGLADEDIFRWCSYNTGLFKIKYYKDEKPKLAYANDTSHLYRLTDDLAYRI